jgi:hypothetical protein
VRWNKAHCGISAPTPSASAAPPVRPRSA